MILPIDEWMDQEDVIYTQIHTLEYYSAIKKKEILPFATTWIWGYYAKWNKSDEEKQIPYDFIYMRNLNTKQKHTHRYRGEEGWREGDMGKKDQLCDDGW